jgi:hypothetical protein
MVASKIHISSFEPLKKSLEALQEWETSIIDKHQRTQAALIAVTNAGSSARGLLKLSDEHHLAVQQFSTACTDCWEFVCSTQKLLRKEVKKARTLGVEFSLSDDDQLLDATSEDSSVGEIQRAIGVVRASVQCFIDTIVTYQETQAEISRSLEAISREITWLTELEIDTKEHEQNLQNLTRRHESRENSLLVCVDVKAFLSVLKDQIREEFTSRLQVTQQRLLQANDHLKLLRTDTEDDNKKFTTFEEKCAHFLSGSHDDFNEDDLAFLKNSIELAIELEKRAEVERDELNKYIDALTLETQCIIDSFLSKIPERQRLEEILLNRPVEDAQLSDYLTSMEEAKEDLLAAGRAILDDYVVRSREPGFSITSLEEIERLGSAVIQAAVLPEQYQSGKIWELAEDILLQLILSNLNAADFFNQFGYTAIIRTLETALEKGDFVKSLQFLAGEFIPQTVGKSREERVRELMANPRIRALLSEAAEQNMLFVDLDHYQELNPANRKTMLMLLMLACELIPITASLQWAALLIQSNDFDDETLLATQQVFLSLLGRSGMYSEMYYCLLTLGEKSPALWTNKEYISMIFPVVRMAKDLEADGKQVLIGLCTNPRVTSLLQGDQDHEFLLACLEFYVTVKWNYAEIYADAWTIWDPYEPQTPILVDVIRKRLQSDEVAISLNMNTKESKNEMDALCAELETELEPRGYRGVRLAELIHSWYVRKYIHPWFDKVRSGDLSTEESQKCKQAILDAIKEKDFVDACPYQDEPPDSNMRPIIGRLKGQLNGRIEKILQQARGILQLNSSRTQQSGQNNVDVEKLMEDIHLLVQDSEMRAWSVKHLLGAHLPKLSEISTRNGVTK